MDNNEIVLEYERKIEKANELYKNNNYKKALKKYKEAISIFEDSESKNDFSKPSVSYYNAGTTLIKLTDSGKKCFIDDIPSNDGIELMKMAINLFSKAIDVANTIDSEYDPISISKSYFNLGYCCMHLRNYNKGFIYMNNAYALDPSDDFSRRALIFCKDKLIQTRNNM